MTQETSDRVALVTGGAHGLGLSMTLGLLERGFRVAAVDRDAAGLDALKQKVGSTRLEIFTADLSLPDAAKVIQQVEGALGRVDVLVNNAGIGQGQVRPDYHRNPPRFFEVTPEQWARAIAVNASAVFLLSRAVVEPMIARRWGRIINITTSLGTMIRGGWTPYGPSKASAEALSAVMAGDLAGTGVTVNVIVPGGIVNTPMIPADAPFAREALVQPDVMLPPLYWLVSQAGDEVTGRRFLGTNWDKSLDPALAAEKAGAPIGWRDLAVLPVTPSFSA
ncbi:SDR family oxidoreductase [Xanthobacter sp. VNH20]|uniref:SDR family NAD(P)-dependent oxidoreductase n=1 Tax=Xanthobacter sp. VNH20 TaxID=3156616 RepID=UPI0032B5F916